MVAATHSVAILVLDDVVPFDVPVPTQALDWTRAAPVFYGEPAAPAGHP